MAARALVGVLLAILLGAVATASRAADQDGLATGVVASVGDGDSLTLAGGQRIRLLQIDAPELSSGDCYARAARAALLRRAPVGSRVTLEADPRLDSVDRFGRLLRYVRRGTANVNVALVRAGAAAPYFYRGEQGRYASQLLAEATAARAAARGLWRACPGTALDPTRRLETGGPSDPRGIVGGGSCDPAYPSVCIASPPPDLDCRDVPHEGFAVRPPDPHRFDGDGDGLGCEP